MKLELRHIAPYLPYGLKAYGNFRGELLEREVSVNNVMSFVWKDTTAKIGLRPLSDLTKEITVNGETFVPIEKLFDIHTNCNWSASDYLVTEKGSDEWWTGIDNGSWFGYNKEHGFYETDRTKNFSMVKRQLQLFQKLFELHLDVFGLIENGLAVDINTLEK